MQQLLHSVPGPARGPSKASGSRAGAFVDAFFTIGLVCSVFCVGHALGILGKDVKIGLRSSGSNTRVAGDVGHFGSCGHSGVVAEGAEAELDILAKDAQEVCDVKDAAHEPGLAEGVDKRWPAERARGATRAHATLHIAIDARESRSGADVRDQAFRLGAAAAGPASGMSEMFEASPAAAAAAAAAAASASFNRFFR